MNDQTKLCAMIFSGLLAFSALPAVAGGTSPTGPANPAESTSPVPPSIPSVDTGTDSDNGIDPDLRSSDPQTPRPGTDGTSTGQGMGTGTGNGTGNDMDTTPRNNGGATNNGGTDAGDGNQ